MSGRAGTRAAVDLGVLGDVRATRRCRFLDGKDEGDHVRPEREGQGAKGAQEDHCDHEKGLFIPCYIDAFFPEVGVATLEQIEMRTIALHLKAREHYRKSRKSLDDLAAGTPGRQPISILSTPKRGGRNPA
jgi:hypothetical protein